MSEPFLGEIRMFAGNFAPQGWALCNGQILPISQNTALFSLLGTYYGGNGQSTFALPNLQGRVAVHAGQGQGLSPYDIGQSGGSETVTLNTSQMPVHTHLEAVVGGGPGSTARPSNTFLAQAGAASIYSPGPSDGATLNPGAIAPAGGSQPFPILQPYLAVTFIIALQGIYPSRS